MAWAESFGENSYLSSSDMAKIILFLCFTISMGAADAGLPALTGDEVVARMIAHDQERQAALDGYTGRRRYILENRGHHKRAEMVVRVTCHKDGSKQFETVSTSGWGGAQKHVFPRLLEAETDASMPGLRDRSRLIPENYIFNLVGMKEINGGTVYVVSIQPKTPNKYLMRGRIWIDAEDYAITHTEGEPARNPSFWIKSVHFVHNYARQGSFWFPVSDRSVTDVRIFGNTEVTIDYFDYAPSPLTISSVGESARTSFQR
jgi:outer membrane lipoprotein-sorting protein